MRRPALALLLAAALASAPGGAAPPAEPAAPPGGDPAPPATLWIEASSVLGTGASAAQGWNEVAVVLQNSGPKQARGRIEVANDAFPHEHLDLRTTAPFAVGPGATVVVRVPALVSLHSDLVVETFDEGGRSLSRRSLGTISGAGASLLDVSETSWLHSALHEVAVTPLFTSGHGSSHGPPSTLSVSSPRYDPATGDPVLPDRAALYASVDAVLFRSDVLTRLTGAELDALAGYVLAGGTLAVALARPEDVRHPTLAAFTGGAVSRQSVYAATLADLVLPAPAAGLGAPTRLIPRAREPTGDVAETLAGYAGGNLHGTLYGSSAIYGLGEVHLLAFDPTGKPAVDDPWVQARMVDLVRRAFDRRSTQVFRPGREAKGVSYGRVRQELDPNESSRWAIAAAALLLIAYAILAGPVNFSLASRAGRPLRALRWLPVFSAVAFALVVAIGVAAKGVFGRARHLTLVEAGAGMGKGSARRFRGFYASRSADLVVRTTDGSSVLSTALTDFSTGRHDHLLVDRDGARLMDVTALPWQTVVVREDGFASIGDGIALIKEGEADVAVVNRSGHDLRGGILRGPRGEAYYFPRIKDGERTTTAAGRRLSVSVEGRVWEGVMRAPFAAGGLGLHRLAPHALAPVLDPDAPGLADAWWALSEAAGEQTDWFPDGVPSLIGQLDGGEGRTSDSGLRLDSDRVLVRVVGWGGRP